MYPLTHSLTPARWQSRTAVTTMMDQVQRIQIRRIERDVFETDELVKRCLNRLGGRAGGGRNGSSGSGSDGGGGRPGGMRRRSARMSSRRGSAASGRFREVEETELRRVRPEGSRVGKSEPSNTGRQRESSRPRYEYEIVNPGRISVDIGGGEGPERRPRMAPARSYNRERDRDRYSGTERR